MEDPPVLTDEDKAVAQNLISIAKLGPWIKALVIGAVIVGIFIYRMNDRIGAQELALASMRADMSRLQTQQTADHDAIVEYRVNMVNLKDTISEMAGDLRDIRNKNATSQVR